MESWPNPLNTPKLWDPYALDFVVVLLFLAFFVSDPTSYCRVQLGLEKTGAVLI